MSKMKLKRPKKTPKECNYNFNGERKSGNTDEECAKLKQQYDKIVEKKKKEMEALKNSMTKPTDSTKTDKPKTTPKKDNAFRDSKNDGNVASRFFERLKARKRSKRERRNSLNPMD